MGPRESRSPEAQRQDPARSLIALCPTCHTRYDRGEIDRPSMRLYKGNLSVLNSRYSDFERRVLEHFARHPQDNAIRLADADFNLLYLLEDGLLAYAGMTSGRINVGGYELAPKAYVLTAKGRAFVSQWLGGEDLEGT